MGLYAFVLCFLTFRKKNKASNVSEFMLGGRRTGAWFSAFAYGTTYFSAVIMVGYAGKFGWNIGITAVAIGIGNAVLGSWLAWKVLARPTREATHRLGVSTMPSYFEARFGSRALRLTTAMIIFVFLVPYSASVYQGISYLFEQVFGVPFILCVIGMAAISALYQIVGGYTTTTMVDFFQGLVMLCGIGLMVFFVLRSAPVGGLANGLGKLAAIDPALAGLPTGNNLVTLCSIVLLTSLGPWGLPQMVHKFYAIRDEASIKRGTLISTLFAAVVGGGAYLCGAFGRVVLNNTMPIDPATGAANVDMVVPNMLDAVLPPWLMALIVVLVLSASMSTLSGLTMSSAGAVTNDCLKVLFPHKLGEKRALMLMRTLCLLFVAVSVGIALSKIKAIVSLMSFSWGTIAGCFLGPFLWGLRDKRTNLAGAWSGIAVGLLTNLGGAAVTGFNGAFAPLLGVISMLLSLIIVPIVSRIAGAKSKQA
ncbi:MAG: sodium:solute symporter [Clostridia bacterium]|nr:sodium:solute symporter [Clostridia bacterium]